MRCGMVPLHERAELPQEVTHREIRDGLAVCQTVPAIPRHLVWRQTAPKFREQPRLAHPRRSDQADHLPLARPHRLPAIVQQRQLPGPPHKGAADPQIPAPRPRRGAP